ncbi:MAG: hypothetical protein ACM3VV_04815 [Deltaproteobacteria bacterium]
MKYAKSIITSTLIISLLIMFYPNYSYSYLGFNNNPEEKNNNSELSSKIIEPSINYVSLKGLDIDIDDQDVICFENDGNGIKCFDKDDLDSNDIDDLDSNDIDDLNINDLNDLFSNDDDLVCFENDDDKTVCFDKDDINNDNGIFRTDR